MATSTFPMPNGLGEAGQDCPASYPVVRVPADGLPSEARALFKEGVERLDSGEPREAIARFEKAVACAPGFSNGYVGLGIAYAMDSQIYPAMDSFLKASEADPESFYAHFKLAQLFFKLRVPKKGYEEASRALRSARALEERRLVGQILKEERAREAGGLRRPTWEKPFSPTLLRVGAGLLLVMLTLLVYAVAH